MIEALSYTALYEALSFEACHPDFEQMFLQSIVNEGKHMRLINETKQKISFDEKTLRVAAAAEINSQTAESISDDSESKSFKKRKALNDDEKTQKSRDRNKEHAKNTRLRKKAYLLKLKEIVDSLESQKEKEDKEMTLISHNIFDKQAIRKNVVRLMLEYQSAGVVDRDKWATILDESVVFSCPITPYRSFNRGDISSNCRVMVGIDSVIADICSLALLSETIGLNNDVWKYAIKRGESHMCKYHMNKEDMVASGDVILCRYVMYLEGSESFRYEPQQSSTSLSSPCMQHGMIKCVFNSAHKITSVEVVYDVMGFMQQLQRVSLILPENTIVPNVVDMALQPCGEARAIVHAQSPFFFFHINEAWTALTGASQVDVMEGDMPCAHAFAVHPAFQSSFDDLASSARAGRPGSRVLLYVNARKANTSSCSPFPSSSPANTDPRYFLPMANEDSEDFGNINCNTDCSANPGSGLKRSYNAKIDNEDEYCSRPSHYSLGYLRMLPLSSASRAISHTLMLLLPLPFRDAEIDEIIAQHGSTLGPVASGMGMHNTNSNSNSTRTLQQRLEGYEAEFQAQLQVYHDRHGDLASRISLPSLQGLVDDSSSSGNSKHNHSLSLSNAHRNMCHSYSSVHSNSTGGSNNNRSMSVFSSSMRSSIATYSNNNNVPESQHTVAVTGGGGLQLHAFAAMSSTGNGTGNGGEGSCYSNSSKSSGCSHSSIPQDQIFLSTASSVRSNGNGNANSTSTGTEAGVKRMRIEEEAAAASASASAAVIQRSHLQRGNASEYRTVRNSTNNNRSLGSISSNVNNISSVHIGSTGNNNNNNRSSSLAQAMQALNMPLHDLSNVFLNQRQQRQRQCRAHIDSNSNPSPGPTRIIAIASTSSSSVSVSERQQQQEQEHRQHIDELLSGSRPYGTRSSSFIQDSI